MRFNRANKELLDYYHDVLLMPLKIPHVVEINVVLTLC